MLLATVAADPLLAAVNAQEAYLVHGEGRGRALRERRDSAIVKAHAAGHTVRAIGSALGINFSYVARIVARRPQDRA
jgi:hypothetical protein